MQGASRTQSSDRSLAAEQREEGLSVLSCHRGGGGGVTGKDPPAPDQILVHWSTVCAFDRPWPRLRAPAPALPASQRHPVPGDGGGLFPATLAPRGPGTGAPG